MARGSGDSGGRRLSPQALARDLRSSAAPTSVTVIAFAVAGALLGAAIVYFGYWSWDGDSKRFAAKPEFRLWAMLVGIQVAGWAVAAAFSYRILRELLPYGSGRWLEIAGSAALLVAVMVLFTVAAQNAGVSFDLPQRRARLGTLTSVAFLVALATGVGMWLVHGALEREFDGDGASDDVQRFARLLDRLQLLLTIQGAILAGAILGAGALRNAVGSPKAYVLAYGVFLSGLVALAYAPTYARARTLGRALRERCLPPPPEHGTPGWSAWLGERKALDELLGINAGTAASLRTGAVILAPLGSGLTSLALST